VVASVNCSYIPFTQQRVEVVYDSIRNILPSSYASYKVELVTDNQPIENLVTGQSRKYTFRNKVDKPLVTALSKPFKAEKGLRNKHIALWQSHGFYFEQKLNRWEWQRARIFQTVEDLYTQSYVLPFLVPMLENAGANVLLPRERDTQTLEVIVDNDKATHPSVYKEIQGDKPWSVGFGKGFAMLKDQYVETETRFRTVHSDKRLPVRKEMRAWPNGFLPYQKQESMLYMYLTRLYRKAPKTPYIPSTIRAERASSV
jgi:hypothetical protein